MLCREERRETVDSVVAKVVEKGKLVDAPVRTYELCLPYCSLRILNPDQEGLEPVVEIAENFGDPNFQPEDGRYKAFTGVRTIYRGGSDGLHEVALQGISIRHYGSTSPPAECLRRSKDSTDGIQFTIQDAEKFDILLQYANQELNPE